MPPCPSRNSRISRRWSRIIGLEEAAFDACDLRGRQRGPANFESRAALPAAEIARIEGRLLEAEHLYERTIRSAHANGFLHIEALGHELAARFYAARAFEKIARAYLRDARYGYVRWGALGKVRQLEKLYPELIEEEPLIGPARTIGTRVEHLDFATVIQI